VPSRHLAVGQSAGLAGWQQAWVGIDAGKHYIDPTVPARVQIPPPRWLVGRRGPAPLTARLNGFSSWRVDPYRE
jgi:hypothetical protein